MAEKPQPLDLLKGTLDVLVLSTLARGPAHGYAISRWIRTVTRDALKVEEGALYPALHRLQSKGWIASGPGRRLDDIGLVLSLLFGGLLESQLFGVAAMGPWTFVTVAVLLAIVGLGASHLPARRISRLDPTVALYQP